MITKTKKQLGTSAEAKRRKRILEAYGKFAGTSKSSSASFAARKHAEITREARRSK